MREGKRTSPQGCSNQTRHEGRNEPTLGFASPVWSPLISPPRSKPRDAPIVPCLQQSATRLFKPRECTVLGVSKRIPRYLAVTNSGRVGQHGSRDQRRLHTRSGEANRRRRVGDAIQLKRARNSLLNISVHVPPEILGVIFTWNIIFLYGCRPHFGGLLKGTYNFLLVCHYWLEVASYTPELWSLWGNALKKWTRRYKRFETAPVDPVLKGGLSIPFGGPLRDTLRERALYDATRSLHL